VQEVVARKSTPEAAGWAISSGRLLQFGPEWLESDERLTFDACSGDYWVLDALGRHVVQSLLDEGVQSTVQLEARCGPVLRGAADVDGIESALARLLEAGLVERALAPAS
jgi:hypothetical protein